MKKGNVQRTFLFAITTINVLVATGYSIAGIVAPQSILPPGTATGQAAFVFALYAAARTFPLAGMVLYTVLTRRANAVVTLGILAGFVQLLDGFVGIYQHDLPKSAGPFFLSALQFAGVTWFCKTAKAVHS